jgi:hypothetical protein
MGEHRQYTFTYSQVKENKKRSEMMQNSMKHSICVIIIITDSQCFFFEKPQTHSFTWVSIDYKLQVKEKNRREMMQNSIPN